MAKQSNRERILQLLHENDQKRTAEEIAQNLGIQRNTASGILNDLAREGKVWKEKTRPVRFSLQQNRSRQINDPFYGLIGADQSLKDAVEKCKLSAAYPKRGMPILIFGDSGVGKSLLAEYIYKYAKFIGAIPKDAPFVVLNCADYANNKELLSSVLFGYKKGTFTGANKDTKGLIEEAGRMDVPGRPILYRTTEAFLRVFSISSLHELPALPALEENEQMELDMSGKTAEQTGTE